MRARYMGVAMWSTLLAMFVTAFGALSLSTDPEVVRASYWLKLEAVNGTSTAKYYLGLRSVVTVRGGGDETTDRLEQDFYVGAIPGSDSRDPVQREVLDACAAGAARVALDAGAHVLRGAARGVVLGGAHAHGSASQRRLVAEVADVADCGA